MKNLMVIFVVVLVACLCGSVRADNSLIYNPSFEIDENPADGNADGWVLWGSDLHWGGDSIQEYIFDPDGAHTGKVYFRGYAPCSDYACTVPVAEDGKRALIPLGPQDTYYAGVWVKDLMPNGQPSTYPPTIEVGYYDGIWNVDDYGRLPDPVGRWFIEVPIPADGQWHYIEGQTIPHPEGYPYLNCVPMTLGACDGDGVSDYAFDDFSLTMSCSTAGNLLVNGSFENGTKVTYTHPDDNSEHLDTLNSTPAGWTRYGDGGWTTWEQQGEIWIPNKPLLEISQTAHCGEMFAGAGTWEGGFSAWAQTVPATPSTIYSLKAWARCAWSRWGYSFAAHVSVPVTAGQTYTLSAYAKDGGSTAGHGSIKLEWYTQNPEEYSEQGGNKDDITIYHDFFDFVTTDDWQQYTMSRTAPEGATHLLCTTVSVLYGNVTLYDDISLTVNGEPTELLTNTGFEIDADLDGRPDDWWWLGGVYGGYWEYKSDPSIAHTGDNYVELGVNPPVGMGDVSMMVEFYDESETLLATDSLLLNLVVNNTLWKQYELATSVAPTGTSSARVVLSNDMLFPNHMNFDEVSLTAMKEVNIDIKPGSEDGDDNTISLGTQGLIPVAIFSTEDFDATDVDPDTVELAGAEVHILGKSNEFMAQETDVDEDGLMDLVVHVATANFNPEVVQEGKVVLTGSTNDEQAFAGWDDVTIVPAE